LKDILGQTHGPYSGGGRGAFPFNSDDTEKLEGLQLPLVSSSALRHRRSNEEESDLQSDTEDREEDDI
jgi:hypothetical protein